MWKKPYSHFILNVEAFLEEAQLLSLLWPKFWQTSLQKFHFLFLDILTSNQMVQVSLFLFYLRILRKRKYNFFEKFAPKSNLQILKLLKLREIFKNRSQLPNNKICWSGAISVLDLAMLFPIQKRDSIQSKNPSQFSALS